MALAEDTNLRGREGLPVIAILVLVALMTLVSGVLAASSSPRSQIPVFVLERGRFTAFDAPGPADLRGQIAGFHATADAVPSRKRQPHADARHGVGSLTAEGVRPGSHSLARRAAWLWQTTPTVVA
jgi:hypothetical protein